jgi:hypothetical protein
MSSAATAPPIPTQPDPGPASTDKPGRFGRVLGLVRKLIDYGRELAASLQQRSPADLADSWIRFGTRDIALILARITSGLQRAGALEARLAHCAARPDPEARPQATPPPRGTRAAAPATRRTGEADARLAHLPTPEQIAAEVRRRPIGAVIADICRDLGILPSHPLWRELQHAIIQHGGSHAALYMDIIRRSFRTLAPDWPASPLAASQVPAPACARPP